MGSPGVSWALVPIKAIGTGAVVLPARVARRGRRALRARLAGDAAAVHPGEVGGTWPGLPVMPGWRVRVVVLPVAERGSGELLSELVAKALSAWQLPDLVDDVELCARELWGNVVRHTRAPASGADERTGRVVLWCQLDDRLRLEVSDLDERMPVLGRPMVDPASVDWEQLVDDDVMTLLESGRGLAIVQSRADALSWQPLPGGGKTVWCEFKLPAVPVPVAFSARAVVHGGA